MRKRDYLKIHKTKYLHVFRCTRLCNSASLKLVKYTTLCDIVHCNLRLLFIVLFLSVKRSVLFHLITHSPSCEHLISPLSFQHSVFQHRFTGISGSTRIVTQLPLPNSPNWNIIRRYSPHFIHPVSHSHSSFNIIISASISASVAVL